VTTSAITTRMLQHFNDSSFGAASEAWNRQLNSGSHDRAFLTWELESE